MLTSGTFVDILAMLPVVLRYYVTGIAGANVSPVGDVMTVVGTTALVAIQTGFIMIYERN